MTSQLTNAAPLLANDAIEDGQTIRPFMNFFSELFDEIKGRPFSFEETSFDDEVEFFNHLKNCLDCSIDMAQQAKLDD